MFGLTYEHASAALAEVFAVRCRGKPASGELCCWSPLKGLDEVKENIWKKRKSMMV